MVRLACVRTTSKGRTQYFCKWQGLPYNQCTWEDADVISGKFQAEINDYIVRRDSRHVPSPTFRRVNPSDFVKLDKQPDWIQGGEVTRNGCGRDGAGTI